MLEVKYLSHIVSESGVRPVPEKITLIQNWPVPHTQKQLQSFLGLAAYYRTFIPEYSKLACPLTELTRKAFSRRFVWTPQAQQAFDLLKARFSRCIGEVSQPRSSCDVARFTSSNSFSIPELYTCSNRVFASTVVPWTSASNTD